MPFNFDPRLYCQGPTVPIRLGLIVFLKSGSTAPLIRFYAWHHVRGAVTAGCIQVHITTTTVSLKRMCRERESSQPLHKHYGTPAFTDQLVFTIHLLRHPFHRWCYSSKSSRFGSTSARAQRWEWIGNRQDTATLCTCIATQLGITDRHGKSEHPPLNDFKPGGLGRSHVRVRVWVERPAPSIQDIHGHHGANGLRHRRGHLPPPPPKKLWR